ncbi:HalOD1 output domain-containing protein [Natronorubrum sp. DTA7]|uniref:HalOD1 output domain-containing protein n=1 Tax=Natronorubrum sp. DTA7 TaxID=3447016 RepID=UPI003F8796A9
MADNDPTHPDAPKVPKPPDTLRMESDCCEFASLDYHVDENAYWAIYRFGGNSPSIAVVSAVAAVSGIDPLDMEPLYSAIDPDAFDELVTRTEHAGDELQITFEFHDCEVAVNSTGSLKVQLPQST